VRDIRICFIGESFINGTGDSTYLGWTGRLCVALSQQGYWVTYYNLGIRRETSTELAYRWQAEAERRLPVGCDNRIVFSYGTNDTTLEDGKLRVELLDSVKNTRQILSVAKKNYPILMVSPPPTGDREQNSRMQVLSGHFATLCQELDVPYLDVFTPLTNSPIWMTEVKAGDGAHPNAAGYSELAQIVQNWSAWSSWFE
jgi:lysophospholipase L1-like esterase